MVNKSYPKRYVPKGLTKKDRKKQLKMLANSSKMYKKGKYITRKKVSSFKSTTSKHIIRAKKMYNMETISPNTSLAKKTKCSVDSLRQIVKKGKGAYFSSGSRPNQTAQSWGIARLASAVTGGKSSAVDFHILEKGCKKNSKTLSLAKTAKRKFKSGRKKTSKYYFKV